MNLVHKLTKTVNEHIKISVDKGWSIVTFIFTLKKLYTKLSTQKETLDLSELNFLLTDLKVRKRTMISEINADDTTSEVFMTIQLNVIQKKGFEHVRISSRNDYALKEVMCEYGI